MVTDKKSCYGYYCVLLSWLQPCLPNPITSEVSLRHGGGDSELVPGERESRSP